MVLAFKEPVGTVCHAFETFSCCCILLYLEMTSFLPVVFTPFPRVAGFSHLLKTFSCFYPHFYTLGIRSKDISQVLTINQEVLFDQCSKQMQPLFQFISVAFS